MVRFSALFPKLFGFIVMLTVFLTAFPHLRTGTRWMRTLILPPAAAGITCFLAGVLGRDILTELLQDFFDMTVISQSMAYPAPQHPPRSLHGRCWLMHGKMFPTDKARETIDGIDVTCIDVAMPMMIAQAADFGISGYESRNELVENKALFERMEALRLEAGRRMSFGDVTKSVTPKIGLIAAPKRGGHFTARYFMPWTTHPTMAVTGSQCLAACALAPGTVAEGLARKTEASPAVMSIEHPMGRWRSRSTMGSVSKASSSNPRV